MNKATKRISTHLLYWVVAWIFLSWFFTRLTHEYQYTYLFSITLLAIAIGTTYFSNYFLIPNYLLKKRYVPFILLTLFTGLISLWFELMSILGIFTYLLTKFNSTGKGLPFLIDPVFLIAGLYLVVIGGIMIHLVKVLFANQAEQLKLENMKLEVGNKLKEAELNSIRAQFHPHFLFNTLNNLYWLTLNKSEQAPRLVLKLSELLDYSLHQGRRDRVPLQEEITYINNYLDIMKIRFEETTNIQIDFSGADLKRQIAPLMLITLVENACKHGLSQLIGSSWIKIRLETDQEFIKFTVSNNHPGTPALEGEDAGLGLNQLKSRLNLIYPARHELRLEKTDHEFEAYLTIHG